MLRTKFTVSVFLVFVLVALFVVNTVGSQRKPHCAFITETIGAENLPEIFDPNNPHPPPGVETVVLDYECFDTLEEATAYVQKYPR